MAKITFLSASGPAIVAEGTDGTSVMHLAIEHSVPAMVAECGGNLTCATCQCYVDPAWVDRLPPRSAEEEALLEYAMHVKPESRLACQLIVSDALDGLVVRMPESQF